jgi:hypothetical protein
MELDDLKQAWQDQKLDVSEAPDVQNIIDMLQNKNYGPIASLREKYKRTALYTAITWIVLLTFITLQKGGWDGLWHQLSNNENGVLYFLLPMIALALIGGIFQFAIMVVLSDLRNIKNPIKSEIQTKVLKIAKYLKWQRWTTIIMATLYLITFELIYHFFHPASYIRDLGPWFNLSIFVRILGYVAYIILIVFISKYSFQKQYGKHVDYLKDLANQLQ